MIKVIRFTFDDHEFADQAFAIRKKVFVDEQGVDPVIEYEHEEQAHHYLLMISDKPVATARWRETEKGIKLERFAVIKEFRNRGIGELILKEVMVDVIPLNKMIYLHSQARAVPFYERNRFVKEGKLFLEAGIEHYYMKYSYTNVDPAV